jgi:phosphatidylglycerophosphate synthase
VKVMGHRQTLMATGEAQAGAAGMQLLMLAGLGAAFDIGPIGLLAGVVYVAGLLGLLGAAMRRAGRPAFGPADVVTLVRALLVGGVTALVVDSLLTGVTAVVPLIVLAAVALALDAVDGQVARRTGTSSAVGARFDMEVDAFLILVLSVHVAGIVGPWALAIGGMRYAFVAAGWALPWLNGELPVSHAAKAVAALQGVVLVVASAPMIGPLPALLVAVALVLLCWSFGRSVLLLAQVRHAVTSDVPRTRPLAPPSVRVLMTAIRNDDVCA